MKFLLNTFFLLLALLSFNNEVIALTDYKIREICQSKRRKSSCIKSLQKKRFNLLNGNRIEIPVIPFKR